MTRWYRRYTGTVSDPKFAEAALIAACSKSVALATFDMILESAAEMNARGQFRATPRNVAATLQEPIATIESVFAAFTELGMIANGAVSRWKERQFESDSSTERSRRHREKAKEINASAGQKQNATLRNVAATPPDTDTDTDTDTEAETESEKKIDVVLSASAREFDELAEKLAEAAGSIMADPATCPGLLSLMIPRMWLDQGADLERDVLPALRHVAASKRKGAKIHSWDYFTAAVANAKARREKGLTATETTIALLRPKATQASPALAAIERLGTRGTA